MKSIFQCHRLARRVGGRRAYAYRYGEFTYDTSSGVALSADYLLRTLFVIAMVKEICND